MQKLSGLGLVIGVSKCHFEPYTVDFWLRMGSRALGHVCVGFRVYVSMFAVFLECCNVHFLFVQVHRCPLKVPYNADFGFLTAIFAIFFEFLLIEIFLLVSAFDSATCFV